MPSLQWYSVTTRSCHSVNDLIGIANQIDFQDYNHERKCYRY
jgi:hypothetical protein